MPRFVALIAGLLAFSGAAQAQTLTPAQKQLVSRLTNEWKTSFRSISTLDMQWKWSGFPLDDGNRHTTLYHFTREPNRHRLDTRFYAWKSGPQDFKSTTDLCEGGYFKDLIVNSSGFTRLTARRVPNSPDNPYGVALPLLEVFGWAMDAQSHLNLETFSSDEFWQHFAPRVTKVEAARWQGQRGWWLSIQRERTATNRVFIDAATLFPLLITGRSTFKSAKMNQRSSYSIQVNKTQPFLVNGQKRLLPLDYATRAYEHNLLDGQRTSKIYSVQALAPAKINAPISPQHWKLAILAKTIVYYAPRASTKMLDERPFLYVAGGGSLWQQDKTAREARSAKLRVMRARALYDEKADGEAQIAAALKLAAAQNKGVLLQFGAYWCSPCHVLHDLLGKNATLAPLVKANYIVVPIDLNGGHNEAVANRLKGSGQGGLPFVVILDASGKRLAAPPSEHFAPKIGTAAFDVEKLATFLQRWKPQK